MHGAISAVLHDKYGSYNTPVYFVSKALKETEVNSSANGELILALVFAPKTAQIFSSAPNSEEHNISYRPRTAVKGQILADFLIEKPKTDAVLPHSEVKLQEPWILFTDGSSCVDGSGAGLILTNPEGMEFTYALRLTSQHKPTRRSTKPNCGYALKLEWVQRHAPHEQNRMPAKYAARAEIQTLKMVSSIDVRPRSVVARALRSGYYWPHAPPTARDMITKCNECQVNRNILATNNGVITITSPMAITTSRVSGLVSITLAVWSVKHPYRTNGLVERAISKLGKESMARWYRHKGGWVEELSHVLWAHRPQQSKLHRGHSLASCRWVRMSLYQPKSDMPTIRTRRSISLFHDVERRIDVDIWMKGANKLPYVRKKQVTNNRDTMTAKVRGVSLARRHVYFMLTTPATRKDQESWDQSGKGPYEVTEALGKGAYKLRDMDGRELPRTWNICNLKKCYL
ncbi:hypothetical protein Tco_1123522 [Tanacetum coccineum]|uniref:Reverse transcriptase/retrotransposon-derived protein RNase H-like domain-containing protein n=1 Tax=Tanacetum coccineum TaxID=301880 RepID=A0ABQ5J3L0_9ASTR